jgi:hypothetical protein
LIEIVITKTDGWPIAIVEKNSAELKIIFPPLAGKMAKMVLSNRKPILSTLFTFVFPRIPAAQQILHARSAGPLYRTGARDCRKNEAYAELHR